MSGLFLVLVAWSLPIQRGPDLLPAAPRRTGNPQLFARVTKFDSATGSCKFLATSSATQEEVTRPFGNNALFSGGAGGVNCDQLKDVVEKDEVKVLATLSGAYTYEARLGGSLTVPELRIDQIELMK